LRQVVLHQFSNIGLVFDDQNLLSCVNHSA
jgi:hypothetical protein